MLSTLEVNHPERCNGLNSSQKLCILMYLDNVIKKKCIQELLIEKDTFTFISVKEKLYMRKLW